MNSNSHSGFIFLYPEEKGLTSYLSYLLLYEIQSKVWVYVMDFSLKFEYVYLNISIYLDCH